jgi:hypothetical protein
MVTAVGGKGGRQAMPSLTHSQIVHICPLPVLDLRVCVHLRGQFI